MFKRIIFLLIFIVLLSSCGTTHNIQSKFKSEGKKTSFFNGFVLYNPKRNKVLINHNGNKYFTPASNTKLFTFYTAYKTLGDSIKGLEYYKTNDSLIIKGTADPSLLYAFDSQKTVNFLKKSKTSVFLVDATIDEDKFGSGWAWDDYPYYYMPEKSLFPVYGNVLTYSKKKDSLQTNINYFSNYIFTSISSQTRDKDSNKFYISQDKEKRVPFITSNELVAKMVSDEIGKKITLIADKNYEYKTFYSQQSDTLYTKLLVDSDNFIAEQLMLQVGKQISGKYSVSKAIQYSLKNYLHELPQKPRWVDGSGLSRYNLFTPNDMVFLLDKMYNEIPHTKLFSYFPVGGLKGTLKNQYKSDKPFVYAKSGSLSNNYNLSGYLITKKGTTLIFSYMNNHFRESSTHIKSEIEKTLLKIYNTY